MSNSINRRELFVDTVLMFSSFILWHIIFTALSFNIENHDRNPIQLYLNCLLFTCILFSISFLIGVPAYSYFKRYNTLNIIKILGNDPLLKKYKILSPYQIVFVVYIFVYMIFFSCFLFDLPVISAIVTGFLGSAFGFSLGMEARFEQDPDMQSNVRQSAKKYYDHSIREYFPFLLCILLFMVPFEIYTQQSFEDNELLKVIYFILLYPLYHLGNYINNKYFNQFEVTSLPSKTNAFVYNVLPILVIILFQSWEVSVLEIIKLGSLTSYIYVMIILIMTGLVPIRLLYILQPGMPIFNRIFGALALIVYVGSKMMYYWGYYINISKIKDLLSI